MADALRELNARFRVGGMSDDEARQQPVKIDAATLELAGMTTWMTPAPFDVLDALEASDRRLKLMRNWSSGRLSCKEGPFSSGLPASTTSSRPRERADRPKDREGLPELRAFEMPPANNQQVSARGAECRRGYSVTGQLRCLTRQGYACSGATSRAHIIRSRNARTGSVQDDRRRRSDGQFPTRVASPKSRNELARPGTQPRPVARAGRKSRR
jgi:hypothetical protein